MDKITEINIEHDSIQHPDIKRWVPEKDLETSKEATKKIMNYLFWVSVFFVLPMLSNKILQFKIIDYAIEVGMLMLFILMIRIRRAIKKKEKIEKEV